MRRLLFRSIALVALLCVLPRLAAQEAKLALKTADTPAPKELSESIRKELSGSALQLYNAGGKKVAELWFRAAIPAEVNAAQLKKGVTYRDLKQGELFGAVRFDENWKDYRKQRIKAGVYTLRLAFQPVDGKHTADISEYPEFLVAVGAKDDPQPAPIDIMKLQEVSGDSIGSGHPGVFMLAPNPQPTAAATLAARPREQLVVNTKSELRVGGQAAGALGIGLTVVGHSPAE